MKYNLFIINGPNLNLLGKRQPDIYGEMGFEEYFKSLENDFNHVNLNYFQSNHEGELIDFLHEIGFRENSAAVMNPGGLSHYSVSLLDAIYAIEIPVVEVHISQPQTRESFRHTLLTSQACVATYSGHGLAGYNMAIEFIINNFSNK
ncbi:MAG: type II 3-dehydroquinate dehydratase [Weeksellaceae bacterium]|nr:type II 3-dehydroquinate dehydratase [Weeksellaceae bacterium]